MIKKECTPEEVIVTVLSEETFMEFMKSKGKMLEDWRKFLETAEIYS